MASSGDAEAMPSTSSSQPPSSSSQAHNASNNGVPPAQAAAPTTFWGRVKRFVVGDKELTKERLLALGFGAFAAYGVISNLNAGVLVTMAWLTIVKTQGVTPLAPGMWPKFLGVYAGLWVGSHFMRPIRLSLALAIAPAFDRALETLMVKLKLPKPAAFGIMLLGVAAFSCAFLFTLLLVFGGFPATPTTVAA